MSKGKHRAPPLDSLSLQWEQKALIGILDVEKTTPQVLRVDLKVWGTFRDASADDLMETIDYAALKNKLSYYISQGSFGLLESLAQQLALKVLEHPKALKVRLKLSKPQALDVALATYQTTYLKPRAKEARRESGKNL